MKRPTPRADTNSRFVQASSGQVVLTLERMKNDGADSETGARKASEVATSSGQLPPSLQRSDLQAQLAAGRYKLRVTFEPSDWSLHPPSRGRVRGSFALQLAIKPAQGGPAAPGEGEACENSAIEARQSDGPFHLYLPRASFSATKQGPGSRSSSSSSLVKVVPLQTSQESWVRVTVSSDFASAALYTTLSQAGQSKAGAVDEAKAWTCKPGYNTCQLDAVVKPGRYSLSFYQPAASGCIKFSLRIQMHPTKLKYGLACHGAGVLPRDLSSQALVSTSTDAAGHTTSRAALRWAENVLMVPESDAGQLDVRDSVLVTLPAGSGKDSYVLHVRHRDARPAARVDVTPFTSFSRGRDGAQGAADASDGSLLVGSDGSWDTLFTASHLSEDQESLFLYKGSESGSPTGAEVSLGLRVSSTLAFRHEPCPTWGLAISLQKLSHLHRAGQCPLGAGEKLPASNLAVNTRGFGFEDLDTYAPVATWPPPDPSCGAAGGSRAAGQDCARTTDTSFTVSMPSQLEVSLSFEGALVSYTLVLISLRQGSDQTTVIASALPVFPTRDRWSSASAAAPPFLALSRVSLSQELPPGKYVIRLARKTALSSSLPRSEAAELCTPLLWRIAVFPVEGGQESWDDYGPQRPYVLDVRPPVRLFWWILSVELLRIGFKST